MGFHVCFLHLHLLLVVVMICCCNISWVMSETTGNDDLVQTYIVHVELPATLDLDLDLDHDRDQVSVPLTHENHHQDLESFYRSFLPNTTAATAGVVDDVVSSSAGKVSQDLVFAYRNIFKGFAARLSWKQVKEMEKIPGFVSARPEEVISLHTTRISSFMGLSSLSSEEEEDGGGGGSGGGLWNQSDYGKGVIIGVLDTGVNPNHPSFSDEGMPPPPTKWKGTCQFHHPYSCNNKIIGARFFTDDLGNTSTDQIGHGTHTASTAAGNFVKGAQLFGTAMGTANGVAPLSHLAIYKVCEFQCLESAILAGIDSAITDGVDVLSLSLGSSSKPFHVDNIAFGAYSAMERGIFVSCSAGNNGPLLSSVANEAPWILTVGASGIDRKITSTVKLGNRQEFNGESAYQPKDFLSDQFPLIYPGKDDNISISNSKFCSSQEMDKISDTVQGKIVVCVLGVVNPVEKGKNVKNAGGIGMILINQEKQGYTTFSDLHVLPATHLSYFDGIKVLDYINSTQSPTASITFKGTNVGDTIAAPTVAYFSSRGPSNASHGILKPDIIGPGLNILAAWPFPLSMENTNVTNTNTNTTSMSSFNIISGTSMACPHLTGVVALLKSVHPHWSPATIKSAIITTAEVNGSKIQIMDQTQNPANHYAMGAGHVNPSKARNPGLIYDIQPDDYVPYLCGLNYTTNEISKIVQKPVNCNNSIPEAQLNYPSFSIDFGTKVQRYTRTVTNVGEADSEYKIQVVPPSNVNVTVKPETLKFSEINQRLKYEVTFSTNVPISQGNASTIITSQGFLSWNSAGKYSVRSPIVASISA